MASAQKGKGPSRGAEAVDYVKTQQRAEASVEKEAAGEKAKKASTPDERGDPAHDSPKRHGDKLEHARDAAAGRAKDK